MGDSRCLIRLISCSQMRTFASVEQRPLVSLDANTAANRAPDVLHGGTDREPRLAPAARRRLRHGAVFAAVLVAAGAAGVEVQERRAAAAEERRLGSVLELAALDDVSVRSSYDTLKREADVELVVHVRNDGPRAVRVLAAQLGEYRWASQEQLPPHASVALLLTGTVHCTALPPPPQGRLDQLLVEAQTATGVQTQTLTLPVELADVAARACGHLPPAEGVGVLGLTPVRAAGAVLLPLEIHSYTVRPIELVAVAGPAGVHVQLQHSDRTPVVLPLQLPTTTPGSTATLQMRAVFTVEDCAATAAAADLADVRFKVIDQAGEAGEVHLAFDASTLALLISDECSLTGHAAPADAG